MIKNIRICKLADMQWRFLQLFRTDSRFRFYLFAASGVWIYLILRAVFIPLVHDEASTFFHYIHIKQFLPYLAHWDANNHILNSGLSILFYRIFGSAEWSLRLANLLFFPVYAWYIFQLGFFLKNTYLQTLFRFVFLLMHGLVEFMALSRGYGMGMALLTAMVYQFLSYKNSHALNHLLGALIYGVLGITANLNLLISFLLCISWLGLIVFTDGYSKKYTRLGLIFFFGLIPVIGASLIAFELKKQGLLYYGAADGFWRISVQSLFKLLFGHAHIAFDIAIVAGFLFVCLGLIFLVLRQGLFQSINNTHVVFPLFFIIGLTAVYIQNKWMGVNLPEDRTGLHLFIYLVAAIFFLTDYLSFSVHRLWAWIALPFVWFPIHFFLHLNLSYSTLWKNEHLPEFFYLTVTKDIKPDGQYATLGGYHIQNMIWYYYNYRHNGNGPMMCSEDYPTWYYDYLLLNPLERQLPDTINYKLLLEDKYSGIGLYKRNQAVSRIHDTTLIFSSLPIETENEFIDFFNGTNHFYDGDSIAVEMYLELTSPAKPLIASAVISFDKPDGSLICYQYISLHWLRDQYTDNHTAFRHVFFIPALPADAERMAITLWNQKKVPIQIRVGHVNISRIRS